MSKIKQSLIIQILLFISLIAFSFQEKIKGTDSLVDITFDHQKGTAECEVEDAYKTQRFNLRFTKGESVQFYMKIEVSVVGEYPTPTLCFSSSDSNCNSPEQLVKNPNGKAIMWLRREQFLDDENKSFYLKVTCQDAGAGYTIKFQGENVPQFGPNFVYSYLVGASNKEMIFEVLGNGENGVLVVGIEGGKSPTMNMEGGVIEKFETGQTGYTTIEESEEGKSLTKITVKGTPDDYITLSVHLTNEEGFSEALMPNGPEIIGQLVEEILEEDCFKMSSFNTTFKNVKKFYLTGRLYSMYGVLSVKDENGKDIEGESQQILNGLISKEIDSDYKLRQICIAFPKIRNIKATSIYYSLSITEPSSLLSIYNYYPPQIPGYIYRRFLPKGKIAFYSPMALENSAKKYNYNMYSIKGLAKMGIAKCTTYPNCEYNSLDGLKLPKSSNQMTIWTTSEDLSSAIGKEKNVIVVQCLDDDNENKGYCLFETSVFNKGQTINLVQREKLSYYSIKEEKGTFKLDLGFGVTAQKIIVDIMVFSGDVTFNLKESPDQNGFSYHKYYLSNKVLFLFEIGKSEISEYNLEYISNLDSFFTIQFEYSFRISSQFQETVPSGENYLVQIDPTSSIRRKLIHLQNFRYKTGKPFLANFFALNCEFEVKRDNEEIEFFDGYAQELLTESSSQYKSDYYDYEISIKEQDLSNYNHKMCMLYIEGYETDDDNQKEIIVGENINQQIIFEGNFKKVRFLYPQADSKKDLAIYANVIDQASYEITVFLNNEKTAFKTFKVTRTQIFYISGNQISNTCSENELCSVIVQVQLLNELVKTNPMIEITIRQIKNVPSYIQKGIAKRDFTCGDNFYYLYTDIGKNEEGEVLVDFLRDFGDMWGKIVRKDQSSVDEEANWRGIYRMPSEEWEDSLEYNRYIKKLIVRTEDTSDCIEGCYLLLSIRVSQIGEYVEDSKFYPFSILTRITPNNRAYTDIPKVVIQVDEYIVGNVDVSETERIYEFYEVWLPHDASRVDFDWQSGVAGLYVNLGGIRCTTKNADFKLLPPGKDSILSLTKEEILKRAQEKKINPPYEKSIQDLSLVIGVWTDKTSAEDTEIYSLRVHEVTEEENKLDIIEVNADKKIMCKPHLISDGDYRCLFMVTYDNDDTIIYTPFFGHASSVDVSAITYMYASFIDRKLYDELDYNGLTGVIPTLQTATYNSKEDGVDYIFINNLDRTKYLFLNVMTRSPQDIMLLANMPLFNFISHDLFEFYPTPGKEQLLSVAGERLRLQFATPKSILVNLVTLTGEAEVFWQKDPTTVYSLRGRGDRLSLSSGNESDHLVIHKRKTDDNSPNNSNLRETMEDPGFLFYISYYIKEKQNFDEVIYGKSLEFAYKDTDLPVILYSKVGNVSSDINVAVTFKDSQFDNSGVYPYPPLEVSASLIKESTIYKAKKDSDLAPSLDRLILGWYDPAIKTAQVMVTKETMTTYNLKPSDNPTLYLSIEKSLELPDQKYNKFSIEVQFSKANEGVIPTEKVYHYGRLGDQSRMTYYRLRIDKLKPFMRIQAAFNSDKVDFYVRDTISLERKNMTFLSEEKGRGKIYITLSTEGMNQEFIYIVFFKAKNDGIRYLYNYAFKYINAKSVEDFVDYQIQVNEDITIKENINTKKPSESTIDCTFHKIDVDKSKVNITYFFKVVTANFVGESSDSIAVMESPCYSVYERNPTDNQGLITLTAKGDFRRWTILQVVAQIQQETIVEYVAYKGRYTYRPPEKGVEEEAGSATAFYVVAGILLVLIIGLAVAVIIFKLKNQALVEQVKHVSFQNTNSANFKKNNEDNSNSNSNVDPNNLIERE